MDVDTHVTEILEQADEGQEIILEPEGQYEEDEEGEVEEIVEIIEEIEEVEDEIEEEVHEAEQVEHVVVEEAVHAEEREQVSTNHLVNHGDDISYISQKQQPTPSSETNNIQICYDASADWEDEEPNNAVEPSTSDGQYNTYITYNNGVNDEGNPGSEERNQINYEDCVPKETSVEDENSQHEIIQNEENNLIYTVLGTKKPRVNQENAQVEFVEVQRFAEENLPEDGTIYYAVNEGDGTYVQAVTEDGQQYHYANEESMEQDNQEWEVSNQNTLEEQQQQQQEEQQGEQEQIFLHEDEDGQLYFKNDQGQLQPVYLTPDGNYAIAENSSDEQDSQEATSQVQEEHMESDNYVLPDLDTKPYSPKKRAKDHSQDDNDDTVTISLIISEDEHGQKRTQVIIPTPAEAKCDICNKSFKTSLQLLKHNRLKHAREEDITTRNFPCDLCPKRFSDQNSLARHRKIHMGDRPFQCLECHKTFPTANILRKHLSMHNPDSHPLPCIYCGRRFSDKISLMKHEQSHLAGEKKTHVCDICQKCFSNPTDLNIHKKNHDPDRKFDCEVCGREFNRLNNLQRHMMVHQQKQQQQGPGGSEEILSCNVCGITYKFSSSLTRHMVTTHMNPEKLRQEAEEQRRKRENNYRRYLENRKTYEMQQPKRPYHRSRMLDDEDDEAD
ncbi:zinc finger protein 135-like isoform X2 [Phymastichus coffea]|nr:zinc finger protein 135-like isoform X2 [Phymastichus coffea]XP_058804819.1 zinc finger protein 135-like isoform X2 [Phymastichus coffea]XP_058804820.1 zinc finger protein 135-like isoform X2 [Phymastichus coffea]XP_058804821.1 zinc finger protein 135-like isoform X2 [Phymastichus coffea]XP_058804822.1 zinc finger protein 135-like isoform X2 [Phymastichus coffea]XP_058804823.1 zinc finger protein 135-like isoform X2 [Phymastichus coffea]